MFFQPVDAALRQRPLLDTLLSGASGNGPKHVVDLKSLFSTGKYSDVIIKCRGNEYKVHRLVICPLSRFFERACTGEFMVGLC